MALISLLDFQDNIDKISEWLKKEQISYTPLSSTKRFKFGWRISVYMSDERFVLEFYVDEYFPYSKINVYLKGFDKFLIWPHFEENGKLCVLPDEYPIDPTNSVKHFCEIYYKSLDLISGCLNGSLQNDFKSEFPSYWRRYVGKKSEPNYCLVDIPKTDVAEIFCYACKDKKTNKIKDYILSSNKEFIESRLKNLSISKSLHNFEKCLFVVISDIPFPHEYKELGLRVFDAVYEKAQHGESQILKDCLKKDTFKVICAFRDSIGLMFSGITLKVNGHFNPKKFKRKKILSYKGVISFLEDRAFELTRADHSWIHGRDLNEAANKLKDKRVLIIGCGSIGSFVANNLALSGVGNIDLVDHDKISYPNTSRHVLGGLYVDQSKAKSLETMLNLYYPHLNIFGYEKKCFDFIKENIARLSQYDLILCTTGDLSSMIFLNSIYMEHLNNKIVYAFVETNALVGHVLSIINKKSCFCCGLDGEKFNYLVIRHDPEKDLRKEPGCGGYFSPYGAIDINYFNLHLSQMLLDLLLNKVAHNTHSIWVGAEEKLKEKEITSFGAELLKKQSYSSFVHYEWNNNNECFFKGVKHD